MDELVIVGASGFANEIRALVQRTNKYSFLGFIDVDSSKANVIGNDDFLVNYPSAMNVVIAIADPSIRRKLCRKYMVNNHLSFPSIVDPSVLFLDAVSIGMGNIICAGSIFTTGIVLGDFNIVNLSCTVGHQASISNYVTLNPGVNISGDVILEDDVSIGTGTQILQGKIIGKRSIVGAGAVVVTDIPNDCTAVGVPAKIIKDRRVE